MISEIVIDELGSYKDFGVRVKSRKISTPNKKKITISVPYMHGEYDFSNIMGDQPYEDREMEYVFDIVGDNVLSINSKTDSIIRWLMSGAKRKLYDNLYPDYYFLAECIQVDPEYNGIHGRVTATFKAYPFKISLKQDGHDVWDDFNFELDMVQTTHFNVIGGGDIYLINNGITTITPIITTDCEMIVTLNGVECIVNYGETKNNSLVLKPGNNHIRVQGTGSIEFKWYKEMI